MKTFLYMSAVVAASATLLSGCPSAEAATFTVLHAFTFTDPGFFPTGDLVIDPSNDVIGTTSIGNQFGTVFRYSPASQAVTFVYNFSNTDGSIPQGSLVLRGKYLYGTTGFGGPSNAGTVYRLDLSSSVLETLHGFEGKRDGANPYGGLTLYDDALYGVDLAAGAQKGGTLFAISPPTQPSYSPPFKTLHAFNGLGTGPDGPIGDVAVDSSGVIYGVTEAFAGKPTGTIYSFNTTTGRFTILHEFTDKSTGEFPFAGVALFGNSLYGTTFKGGARNRGTLWTYDIAAKTFAVIHSFTGTADGEAPQARPAITHDGILYGTAYGGGAYGFGTVFTMDLRTGTFGVLHDFQSTDGQYPLAGVVVGKDGTLYGTTSLGGDGVGTLFSIVP